MSHLEQIFISPSSEFVALCQSQMGILTQGLEATSAAVYLTESLMENREAKLIPVVIYPSNYDFWQKDNHLTYLPEDGNSLTLSKNGNQVLDRHNSSIVRQHQIVLPLMYEEVVMGLLVAQREKQDWNQHELTQIEKIAQTLAIARLLDQRQVWLEQQLNEQEDLKRLQYNKIDDFLHQIRNPITALRTFSKLLLKRLLPNDVNHKVAQSMLRESDHLKDLAQEFEDEFKDTKTDISSLTLPSASSLLLPSHSLSLESIIVKDILEPVLISAAAIAEERGIKFSFVVGDNLPLIQANAKALREVFNNIIDNALKYTPSGGEVAISIVDKPHYLGIVIADTGVGIPAFVQENLFQRYYRGIQADSDIAGDGLGLAIAKDLLAQMSGTIELISPNFWSENPSFLGSTFIIWLAKQ